MCDLDECYKDWRNEDYMIKKKNLKDWTSAWGWLASERESMGMDLHELAYNLHISPVELKKREAGLVQEIGRLSLHSHCFALGCSPLRFFEKCKGGIE